MSAVVRDAYSQRTRPVTALVADRGRSLVGLREERRSEVNDEGESEMLP